VQVGGQLVRFSYVVRPQTASRALVALGSAALLAVAPASAAAAPSVDFIVSSPLVAGAPATFTSTSTPEAGTSITTTEWSFGDGTPRAVGEQVEHTYASAGQVKVKLTVMDDSGQSASLNRNLTVLPPPPPPPPPPTSPTAAFSYAPALPVAGRPTAFVSTVVPGSGGAIVAVEWDFDGDGVFEVSGPTAEHTFPTGGTHLVRLRVSDTSGLTAEAARQVIVNAPPTAAFAATPSSPVVGETVMLVSHSSDAEGALAGQVWDLDGDGDFDDASGSTVTGMFTGAGQHLVSLRVTDVDGASAVVSRAITVRPSEWLNPIGGNGGPLLGPNGGGRGASPAPEGPAANMQGPFIRLLTPFPIVRLAGRVTQRGTHVQILGVRAPAGSRAKVVCRGPRCPSGSLRKALRGKAVRFRAMERFLTAGSVVEVLIRRGDQIGKYTRFQIRRKRPPKRTDGCLPPGTSKAVTCPVD
jgi:PKD repeat protein